MGPVLKQAMTAERKPENDCFSRREFLQLSVWAAASLVVTPHGPHLEGAEPEPETELLGTTEKQGFLESKDGLRLFVLPLRKDYFYDQKRPVQEYELAEGLTFSYKNIYYLRGEGETFRLTMLPHITGSSELSFAEVKGSVLDPKKIFSAYTYSAEVYPNKILNILTAVGSFSRYQEENGSFREGETYSILALLNLTSPDYLPGLTSSRAVVKGGGVCASASTLAKSLYLLDSKFIERWQHPTNSRYFVGPGDAKITKDLTDATVDIGSNGKSYDFVWRMPKDAFLAVNAAVIPNGRIVEEDLGGEADARLIVTLSWATEEPVGQVERLIALKESYRQYRQTESADILLSASSLVGRYGLGENSQPENLLRAAYPEEKRADFQEELTANPWLKQISRLAEVINTYSETHPADEVLEGRAPMLGEYLKTTSWYLGEKSAKVDAALRHLNQNTYLVKDEAIQCIGWVILLSALEFSESPKSVSGQPICQAQELVPKEIRNQQGTIVSSAGLLFRVVEKLAEVKTGDLFVTYENSTPGHIGAVVGKKEVKGKTVLLIADANKKSDGRVRIYEVDETNFDAIFGSYPYKKVVIKK